MPSFHAALKPFSDRDASDIDQLEVLEQLNGQLLTWCPFFCGGRCAMLSGRGESELLDVPERRHAGFLELRKDRFVHSRFLDRFKPELDRLIPVLFLRP